MSGGPFPSDLKGSVQLWPMDFDEGADAAIRVGTAHNRENGKQQDMFVVALNSSTPLLNELTIER